MVRKSLILDGQFSLVGVYDQGMPMALWPVENPKPDSRIVCQPGHAAFVRTLVSRDTKIMGVAKQPCYIRVILDGRPNVDGWVEQGTWSLRMMPSAVSGTSHTVAVRFYTTKRQGPADEEFIFTFVARPHFAQHRARCMTIDRLEPRPLFPLGDSFTAPFEVPVTIRFQGHGDKALPMYRDENGILFVNLNAITKSVHVFIHTDPQPDASKISVLSEETAWLSTVFPKRTAQDLTTFIPTINCVDGGEGYLERITIGIYTGKRLLYEPRTGSIQPVTVTVFIVDEAFITECNAIVP